MKLPFTIDGFLNVFKYYNESVWPIQVIFFILALISVILIAKRNSNSSRIATGTLALFWIWMGLVYHILFFSPINKAAYLFGVVFLIQGLIFLYFGVIKQRIQFEFNLNLSGIAALIFIGYSLILYPLIGYVLGHVYPRSPTFGVPCPTTIFTFGILLFSIHRIPWYIIIIPLVWSVVGFFAALNLLIKEDYGLAIAGIVSTAVLFFNKPKVKTIT